MKPVDAVIEQHREVRGIERGRLFRKYFLLILGLVCGALLISGGIGIYFSYQENKTALLSLQREKAVAAAVRIEQFIRQIEQQLAFAALPQLGAEGMEQRRIEFLKLSRLVPAITDTTQIDPNGRERLAVSRLGMDVVDSGIDRSGEVAFKGARADQTWFGPVAYRKQTEPYMSIAMRSKGESGSVTVADVNLKFIWDVVTRIKIGKKGKAYVVDGSGHLVADPDIGLVLRKTDMSKLPQVRFALEKGAEESLALVAEDLTGAAVLTAYGSIESVGWKVFVEQPVSEIFETLNATIVRTGSLILAGLLISALAAMWLARSMVHPIRILQEGAARIGAGDLEQRIEIKTGDELEALAEQFNQMSVQLRESYAGLERQVEPIRTSTAASRVLATETLPMGLCHPSNEEVAILSRVAGLAGLCRLRDVVHLARGHVVQPVSSAVVELLRNTSVELHVVFTEQDVGIELWRAVRVDFHEYPIRSASHGHVCVHPPREADGVRPIADGAVQRATIDARHQTPDRPGPPDGEGTCDEQEAVLRRPRSNPNGDTCVV